MEERRRRSALRDVEREIRFGHHRSRQVVLAQDGPAGRVRLHLHRASHHAGKVDRQMMSAQPATVPEGIGDLELAARVASRDGAAFELLMRRHNRRLYRIARSVLRDDADAEDALQESYLAAYRAIGAFRGESSLATWLSRLVLNHCLARRRREQRRDNIVSIVP